MELNKNILAFLCEFTELMEKYKVIDIFINEDTHAINFLLPNLILIWLVTTMKQALS